MVLMAAMAILVFNLMDGVLTLGVIYSGVASEANPLMKFSLDSWGAVGFMIVKLTLVSLGVLLLWRLRHRRSAVAAIFGAAGVYALLLVYHLHSVHALIVFLSGNLPLG
jgi:hypothetical protein